MQMPLKEKLFRVIPFLIFIIVVGGIVLQRIQFYRTIKALTSIEPQQVTTFKIYPKVTGPFGVPIEFRTPEPIIDAFVQSLTDLLSYWGGRYTVTSEDHGWFLEITAREKTIQMGGTIPSDKGDIIVGSFGKVSKSGGTHYGYFQSHLLFEWYQTYSHRWLKPDQ